MISCGGPKRDTNKMLKHIKEYTDVAEKALSDRLIDDKEAEKLNKIKDEINKYSEQIDLKYKDDNEAQKVIQQVMSESQNRQIMLDYANVVMRLWKMNGYEKLK